jgi:hypothetical protein
MLRNAFVLLLLVFAAGIFFGMKDGKERKFERMRKTMIRACMDSSARAGPDLPHEAAQAFCDCTIGKLTKDHGYEELDRAFVADPAGQPAWLKKELQGNARTCADAQGIEITFGDSQ